MRSAVEALLGMRPAGADGGVFSAVARLLSEELRASEVIIGELERPRELTVQAHIGSQRPPRIMLGPAWAELVEAPRARRVPPGPTGDELLASLPAETWVAPIRADDGMVTGLLIVGSPDPQRAREDLTLLMSVAAARVALAIVDQRQQAELASRRALASATVRIGAMLDTPSAQLRDTMEGVCREIVSALDVTAVAVTLLDPDKAQFLREAQVGLPQAWMDHHPPQARVDHFEKRAALWSPVAVFEGESLKLLPAPDLYRALDLRSIMQTVLRDGGRVVGMLGALSFGKDRSFDADERLWFDGIGHRVAQGVRAARLTAKVVSSEARYRKIFENCLEGVWVIDASGIVAFANPALAHMLGYRREEMVGRSARDFMPESAHPEAKERFARRKQGIGERRQFRLRHRDGHELWVVLASNPVFDDRGHFEGVVGFVTDLTERRELEQRVQQAQKIESLGLLAGGLAHDFNNLLVGVLGNASFARMDVAPSSRAHAALEGIETAAMRAADLTRQMLAYAGKAERRIEAVDLNAVITDTVALLSSVLPKSATLKRALATAAPIVQADVTQMRQIVMNLLTNAGDALEGKPGTITVTTGLVHADRAYLDRLYIDQMLDEGEYVFLEVRDSGCGMNASTLARVFDPFFSTKFAGRGLGMAAVLGILRSHRGAIRVDSEPGQGSTFRVLLPKAPPGATAAHRSTLRETPKVAGAQVAGTVLVVDDEAEVARVAQRALEHAGFRVLTASEGYEALRVFEQHADQVRAVVLDLTMPGLQGDEVLKRLRALRPDVRVVLCSGYDEQDVRRRLEQPGAVAFLPKPFTLAGLVNAVKALIS